MFLNECSIISKNLQNWGNSSKICRTLTGYFYLSLFLNSNGKRIIKKIIFQNYFSLYAIYQRHWTFVYSMAWIIRFYNVAHIMKTTNSKNESKDKTWN